ATCVIPYDPMEDKVVLLEQFRPGAILEDQSPWLLELVAGMNDEGEHPENVARREAQEEARLELGELEKICEYLVSPGGTTEKVYLYCAKVSVQGVGGVFGLAEEDEDIKVHCLDFEAAYKLVENGTINNAAAIMGLQWLALNRERLREQWR
ncbi:NUDIX domain-containing protein, partial [Oleiphilus sp. HI0128]